MKLTSSNLVRVPTCTGSYFQFKAKAIGAGSEGAQATLQDKYRDDMSLAEAENLAFEILKQVMEEKINNVNVEVASVTEKVLLCIAFLFALYMVECSSAIIVSALRFTYIQFPLVI